MGDMNDVVEQLNEAPTQGTRGSTVNQVQVKKIRAEIGELTKKVTAIEGASRKS